MIKLNVSAFDLAQRFVGTKEMSGAVANPQILAMLRLDQSWPEDDDVAWCSAFCNYIAWLLRLPRSKSLRARSWLTIGYAADTPEVGFDIVILKRGPDPQPGPEVLEAPGHVGFFAGYSVDNDQIMILGGNQGDAVNVGSFPAKDILGIRRLVT